MSRDREMANERKRSGWLWVLLALLVLYAFSYAPAIRLTFGSDRSRPLIRGKFHYCGYEYGLSAWYWPLEWIVDNSPSAGPLQWWAGVWGVEEIHKERSYWRVLDQEY